MNEVASLNGSVSTVSMAKGNLSKHAKQTLSRGIVDYIEEIVPQRFKELQQFSAKDLLPWVQVKYPHADLTTVRNALLNADKNHVAVRKAASRGMYCRISVDGNAVRTTQAIVEDINTAIDMIGNLLTELVGRQMELEKIAKEHKELKGKLKDLTGK